MNHQREVFFVAGDPSGDVHAASLARALAQIAAVGLRGAGGPRMRAAGGSSKGTEYHFTFIERVPLPRPRITRPFEISSTSIAADAASSGVRMNA